MNQQEIIRLIRDQIRVTVDPMFLKNRQELFGGPFTGQLKGSLIPREVISNAVSEGIQDVADGEAFAPIFNTFTAGSSGVQFGKVLYYTGSVVEHASANTLSHADKIVGIAMSAAGPGSPVNVQAYGFFQNDSFAFTGTPRSVLLGNNGSLVNVPVGDAAFIKFIGIAVAANRLFAYVSPDYTGV